MSKHSTAIAVGLVGVGLLANALVSRAPAQNAAGQAAGKTIVWLNVTKAEGPPNFPAQHLVWRAWSDGSMEVMFTSTASYCLPDESWVSCSGWKPIPFTGQGYACAADLNRDRTVDGDDLGTLLGAWGPAPECEPLPPIECGLNMISR